MGGSQSYDHIFTKPLLALSPSPTCTFPHPPCFIYFMPFMPFIVSLSYVSVVFLFHFNLTRVHLLPTRVCLSSFFSHSQQGMLASLNYTLFPVVIPLQPPFYYACLTNYSSLILHFSHLPYSPHDTVLSHCHTYTPSHTFPLPYLRKSPIYNTYSTRIQILV